MENQNRDIAIALSGVKKQYRLGQIGGGTLQRDLQSWWARLRGKEDPNTPVGTDQRLVGQTFMALNGIDLTVYKGEALGIIGSNGAGKSTLLKLLSRVTAPTEGTIDIFGRIASMLEVGTGFHGEMTGRENIYMNGAILGMTKAEIDAKMEDIIDFSEVREFIDTPVKRYSSGMYVKLAFSVAAHLDSEIMIMDEVLAVGDVNFQQKCIKKMRAAANEDGRTVLYVSHNMNTIRQLCDRCIVLDQGKIVFNGAVEEAINIYLSQTAVATLSQYDYSKIERTLEVTGKCKLTYAQLKKSFLEMHEPFIFSLTIDSSAFLPNTMLRYVLFDQKGGVVGATYSQPFTLAKGVNVCTFSFDTSLIAPGHYYGDLIVVGYDGQTQLRHDIITQAFTFAISETQTLYNMKWNNSNWGNIHFPTIHVIGDTHAKD